MSDNDLIARFQRARGDTSLVLLEGFHCVKHAIRFGAEFQEIVGVDKENLRRLAGDLAPDIFDYLDHHVVEVPRDIFMRMAPIPPATGVLAIARRPSWSVDNVLRDPAQTPVIFLEQASNLGNIGAVVRVAAATGAAGVITSGLHDPWHPVALRGSAGLHFALPVVGVTTLPACDRPIVAIHPEGNALPSMKVPKRAILAFGSERRGLSGELLGKANSRMAIPMQKGVSSLNLATAVAVILYAWRLSEDSWL